MCEYFIVVVKLCRQTLAYGQMSALAQLKASLTDQDIKRVEAELKGWGATIKNEVGMLTSKRVEDEADENSRFRIATSKFSAALVKQARVKTRMKWLDECSQLDYVTVWKQVHRSGNTALYRDSQDYQTWKTADQSTTIFIKGILGSGKSVLLANIVDDLHLSNSGRAIAYFFCRQENPDTLKSRTIIGCLARQILQPLLYDGGLDGVMGDITTRLDVEGVVELVEHLVPPTHTIFFVLDGADECTSEERRSLGQALKKLQQHCSLSICVSIRTNADNLEPSKLHALSPDLHMTMPKDNPDIGTYIQTQLEKHIESGRLVLGDPRLALEIRKKVTDGANGM